MEPAPLDEDLRRRDFTVNAIAIALAGERAGELTAAPDALEDLEARRLRVLHDGSFIDDPTRLFRLVRYASRLGFEIEPHTRALAEGAIAAGALDTVSGPRIGAELRLLAREPDPVRALSALADLGLDVAVHPAFGLAGENETLARRALTLLPDDGRPDRLALSVAARGVPATDLSALLDALAFEAEDRDAILLAATSGGDLARALSVARAPSAIAASAAGAPPEVVALAGALGAEQPARAWLDVLRHVRLAIDGRDLLAAGVPEGPAIGHGLRAALAAKLDGRADGREQELAVALAAAGGSGSGGSGPAARPGSLRACRMPRTCCAGTASPGHYEVYYLTLTDPRSGVGVWIRYTMTAPLAGAGERAVCVAVVRGDGSAPRLGRPCRPARRRSRSTASPPGPIRSNCASPTRCWRTTAWPARSTTWPGICAGRRPGGTTGTSIRCCSGWALAQTVLELPHADLSIDGTVDFAGERLELAGARGGQAHLWGSKHARSWAWVHCNDFGPRTAGPRPGAFVDAVSVTATRAGRDVRADHARRRPHRRPRLRVDLARRACSGTGAATR